MLSDVLSGPLFRATSRVEGVVGPQYGGALEIVGMDEAEHDWRAFEARAIATPYQSYDWLKAWADCAAQAEGESPLIVFGRNADGRLDFILPLAKVHRYSATLLQWLATPIQNTNAPLYNAAFLACAAPSQMEDALRRTVLALPEIDAIDLRNNKSRIEGYSNPLAALGQNRSIHDLYSARVDDGFEAHDIKCRSGRSRSQMRRLEKRLAESHSPMEYGLVFGGMAIEETIDAFIGHRETQRQLAGVPNRFASPHRRAFLQEAAQCGALDFSVLKAGGKIRAVNGFLARQKSYSCFLFSAARDETAQFSVGMQLLVQSLSGRDEAYMDFGMGQEAYKDKWFQAETMTDWSLPLSERGWLVLAIATSLHALKRRIRTNNHLWNWATASRRVVNRSR